MKKCIFACSLVFFSMGAVAQSLTRGTPIPIKVVNTISSKDAGNSSFEVSDDVKASDGTVIIKHGTPVTVSVNSKRARGCGRPGSLDVKFVSTQAVNGQTIMLEGIHFKDEGRNKTALAVGLGVGLGVGCFPPLLALLAIKGEQAVIEEDTYFNGVRLAEDFSL
ncbi:MAG: hypothetical protein ACI36Z_01275 [Alloprevotella sp.]